MTKTETPEEKLLLLYKKRESLYRKGANDEKLNDKIRVLQKEIRIKNQ